ncbi:MAG: purine-nucleoside phosphorylase [Hungatella sp.]
MKTEHTPTPHIDAQMGEIAETILLPGDPLRARYIADHFLEDVKQFNKTRGMLGFTGTYEGKPVSVMGTGMGCPSIGIYSYELIHFYGVKNLIRIGTAGAMQPEVKLRDVVIGMGACAETNYLEQYELPGNYACVASYELLSKAVKSAENMKIPYHVGNILCTDVFYKPQMPAKAVSWSDMGILACEMESAALYANAAYGKANALCILTISDSGFTEEVTTAEEREVSFTAMMKLALSLV